MTSVQFMHGSSAEVAMTTIRNQAALVRALIDELDRLLPHAGDDPRHQLADELRRLGRQMLETAALLDADSAHRPSDSVIRERRRPD
jgi:hypothetical protein